LKSDYILDGDQRCKVTIRDINTTGPDDDGELGFNVQYALENTSGEDWQGLSEQVILLDGNSQFIDHIDNFLEQTMPAGETVSLVTGLGGVNAKLFGGEPANGQLILRVAGYGLHKGKLDSVTIPTKPYSIVGLKPTTIGDIVNIVSGSLWRTPTESDNACQVVVRLLCEASAEPVSLVVEAALANKKGRNVTTLDGGKELRPGEVAVIECSGYLKQTEISGGLTASVAVKVFVPTAAAAINFGPFDLTETRRRVSSGDQDEPEAQHELELIESDEITIRFPLTNGEGNFPEVGSFSAMELEDIRKCCTFTIFIDLDAFDGDESVEIIGIEFLYDGVTPIEGENYGYRIENDELTGYPAPIVRFKLKEPVNNEKFRLSMRDCTFSLITSSMRDDGEDPYFAEDNSGYTSIIDLTEIAGRILFLEANGAFCGSTFEFPDGLPSEGFSFLLSDLKLG
jgi:hypothetical protein